VQRFGIKPGLERIQALLERVQVLGGGSSAFPCVLVGGTNGKGSTAQFLSALLRAPERKIGLYTSPHLHEWNERIRVLDEASATSGDLFPGAISDQELEALFQDARPHLDAVAASEHGQPTEFEVLTLLGLWHFARRKVGAAVVEVGLGGKWDATNVLDPLVSVVTHVALDHCDRLGTTLEAIASDKIHIARPNRVVVTAEDKPQVLEVFREHCDCVGARLWPFRSLAFSNDAQPCGAAWERVAALPLPNTPEFQRLNLQTARLSHVAFGQAMGWPLEGEAAPPQVLEGVPGRYERVRESPIVVLDGANNPDGAARLAQVLGAEKKRVVLVVGVSSDKDFDGMLQGLAGVSQDIVVTQASHPRALPAQELAEAARKYFSRVRASSDVNQALRQVLEAAGHDELICVTGSFFVLGEVDRAALKI
jgi:dihydrofolate synthase/folylpolyglutamate synthase